MATKRPIYKCANRKCGKEVTVNGYVPSHSIVVCGQHCHTRYLEQQALFQRVLEVWEPHQQMN